MDSQSLPPSIVDFFFVFLFYVYDLFDESPRFTSLDDHAIYIGAAHYFPTRLTHFSLTHLTFFFGSSYSCLTSTCATRTWETR